MLTTTSIKGGFLYFGLLFLIVVSVIYFLLFSNPSVQNNFYERAFKLNYSAFKNGIQFANYRFITDKKKDSTIDKWINQDIGLDYNEYGFPIGTEISDITQESPVTADDCRHIWQFVLGPLRPDISFTVKNKGYWVQLTTDKVCVFRSGNVANFEIHYRAIEGNVLLVNSLN